MQIQSTCVEQFNVSRSRSKVTTATADIQSKNAFRKPKLYYKWDIWKCNSHCLFNKHAWNLIYPHPFVNATRFAAGGVKMDIHE